MTPVLLEFLLSQNQKTEQFEDKLITTPLSLTKVTKVNSDALSYNHGLRNQWVKPEYDFTEIQIAQDSDSYLGRAIDRKTNRIMTAGFEFTGKNPEPVNYIKTRIKQMSMAVNKPFQIFLAEIAGDLFRFDNAMVLKVRQQKASTGDERKDLNGQILQPVAGYFQLPFETLEYKTKSNGEFKKIMQRMPTGEYQEFFPKDIVHFYKNKKPGFIVGTPLLWSAIDDIKLLRRLEEQVHELIETNLFPVYHYAIGTDEMPERVTSKGVPESEFVKQKLEYMPAAGIYVSDHRHKISALGSEGKALRIDFYLQYFKSRVFAAIGSSPVDMGEGDSSNRSTASTISKSMTADIEAVAAYMKAFVDFYIIGELLLEGGYDPLNEDESVEIKFGVIDREERRADENHSIQLFHGNGIDMDELRKRLGELPWKEEQMEKTFFKLFAEPTTLAQMAAPGTAEATLSKMNVSNITPEAVKANQKRENEIEKQKRLSTKQNGGMRASAARNKPSNQHGTRSTSKSTKDIYMIEYKNQTATFSSNKAIDSDRLETFKKQVIEKYMLVSDSQISLQTIIDTMLWRLGDLND